MTKKLLKKFSPHRFPKSPSASGLDKGFFGVIMVPFKSALTEKNPRSGGQRGTHRVEGSRDTRRLYHS